MTEIDSNKQSSYSTKSNEQRLKSIEKSGKEKLERKRLIKDSLKNQSSINHLKFDSDDEDNKGKVFLETKRKLFDDETLPNFEENFVEKKFSKTEGKLKALQAKLTTSNDPRFKFSENFLDETPEISIEEEKNKSLAILDELNAAKSSSKGKTKMVRFDPSKSEHQIYEIKEKNENDHQRTSQTRKVEKSNSNSAPILDKTRSYELKTSELKNFFDKTAKPSEEQNFQFKFFKNEPEKVEAPILPPIKLISNGKKRIFPNQPEDSSSDEEIREKQFEDAATQKKENLATNQQFFFFEIDDRLNEGLTSFVRTEDLAELEQSWPTKRKEIAEALRVKHRKAIQRQDRRRIFHHRRRQQQKQANGSTHTNMDQD